MRASDLLDAAHHSAGRLDVAGPLAVRDLVVRGGGGRVILRADVLDVAPGTLLGVRGPSGAGKTTLLHALAGLVRPASGAVRWGDADLAAMGEAARDNFRRLKVGLIFQDFLLFEELTALENAAVAAAYAPRAARAAIRDRAALRLRALGVEPGRGVGSMSGGERQRVAVARALATDPPILLADEPTASLDRAAADALVADLTDLARSTGRTLIAVSHDPAVLAAMDRVADIRDGALIEGGGDGRA